MNESFIYYTNRIQPQEPDFMPPARARQPRQSPEKSLARLTDIAEAATACFSETGFRRTQVADIARRMGVSVGTLYLYADSNGVPGLVITVILSPPSPYPSQIRASMRQRGCSRPRSPRAASGQRSRPRSPPAVRQTL